MRSPTISQLDNVEAIIAALRDNHSALSEGQIADILVAMAETIDPNFSGSFGKQIRAELLSFARRMGGGWA